MSLVLIYVIWIPCSRYGTIKLGPEDSQPQFSTISWISMLFSAGMGTGLLFFGVAEPLLHYQNSPTATPLTPAAAREALNLSFFHWGLNAWALYALFAMILAYFAYRKNFPLLPRSLLAPMLGKKINGPIGSAVDVFCVLGTLFGVATTLGYGSAQINAGMSYLLGTEVSQSGQLIIIACVTLLATSSVVLGLDKGIKQLSLLNVFLAILALSAVLLLTDSVFILNTFIQSIGSYIADLPKRSFQLYTFTGKTNWLHSWTIFYWGWWVAWAPFVGLFIARISKGRTIREFVLGVLVAPCAFTFMWFTTFGASAIKLASEDSSLIETAKNNLPLTLFQFLESFPFSTVLCSLCLVLLITFFVSSSDSGSMVIDHITSGGQEHPPTWQRIYWALLEGLLACLLLLTGGLSALQTMTMAASLPMIFIITLSAWSFTKEIQTEKI